MRFSVHQYVVAGLGVRIAGNVRHAPPAAGRRFDIRAGLPGRQRKLLAEPAAARAALGPSFHTVSLVMAPLALLQTGAAAAQNMRAGGREIHVIGAVADSVAGPVVAGGGADRDPQRGGVLRGRIESRHSLRRPGGFGAAPADRNDRRLVGGVVNRRGQRVLKSLRGVGREIDHDLRPRRHRSHHFDIQQHFAIRAVRIGRLIFSFID